MTYARHAMHRTVRREMPAGKSLSNKESGVTITGSARNASLGVRAARIALKGAFRAPDVPNAPFRALPA
jgi:hypothetical protein